MKIFLLVLLMPLAAFADDLPAICNSKNSTVTDRAKLNGAPSYFAKVFATQKYATIMMNNQDWLVNIADGSKTALYGNIDPVPTPDEKFLVSIKDNENLFWASTKDILAKWGATEYPHRIPADNFSLAYAYESLGRLSDSTDWKKNYRMVVDDDKGTLRMQDVSFTLKSVDDPAPTKTESGWTQLCQNVSGTLKLPMISKDGRQMSAYNISLGQTEIFKIQDNGNCDLVKKLPYATGKADFNFDGSAVTFHMGKFPESKNWFKFDNAAYHLDVYKYDLKKDQLTKVTDNADGDSYFPTFRKDGSIGFIEAHHNKDGDSYDYSIADPDKNRKMAEGDLSGQCDCDLKKFSSYVAIGSLRDDLCSTLSSGMSLESTAAVVLSVNHSDCVKAVQDSWDKLKTDIIKNVGSSVSPRDGETTAVAASLGTISEKDLEAACPGGQLVSLKARTSSVNIKVDTSPKAVLADACSKCHTGGHTSGGQSFDVTKLGAIPADLRKKMADRILKGQMPPGGLPDQKQRKTISDYLMSIK